MEPVAQYPHFSEAEYTRRYIAIRALMQAADVAALVVYGSPSYMQGDVHYLTNYATTREAICIFPLEGAPTLFVQMYNHVPTARKVACINDVQWGGTDTAATAANHLHALGLAEKRIGIIGRFPAQHDQTLRTALPKSTLISYGPQLMQLRLIKSAEEIDALRRGAQFCDLAVEALQQQVRPGMVEYELAAIVQGAYLHLGGRNSLHYMATTPMAQPSVCVPAQYQSDRVLAAGDVLITELSASWMEGYPGQILRSFTIASAPTPTYQHLFDVAVEAFQRITQVIHPGATTNDVLDAAQYIHDEGYTIYDDLVHGYGGGYLAPILRTRQTSAHIEPPMVFQENMTIVVQPNIITPDERMGVQVGQLLRITATGVESLHRIPMEFLRCD